MWGTSCAGGLGDRSPPSGVQGQSLSRGSGGRSPPEGEAILDFYMHNFDLILNYFPPLQILGGDVSPPPLCVHQQKGGRGRPSGDESGHGRRINVLPILWTNP